VDKASIIFNNKDLANDKFLTLSGEISREKYDSAIKRHSKKKKIEKLETEQVIESFKILAQSFYEISDLIIKKYQDVVSQVISSKEFKKIENTINQFNCNKERNFHE
jgi:hypothetical protein